MKQYTLFTPTISDDIWNQWWSLTHFSLINTCVHEATSTAHSTDDCTHRRVNQSQCCHGKWVHDSSKVSAGWRQANLAIPLNYQVSSRQRNERVQHLVFVWTFNRWSWPASDVMIPCSVMWNGLSNGTEQCKSSFFLSHGCLDGPLQWILHNSDKFIIID